MTTTSSHNSEGSNSFVVRMSNSPTSTISIQFNDDDNTSEQLSIPTTQINNLSEFRL
jgi:hypothetical protein